MAKIKGVWVFNDVVSHFYWLASYQMINVTFTSNGERFTSLYWYDVPAGDDTIYHLSYDETLAVAGPFGNLYNWDNDAYKTVDFGSAEQDVSDEFLAWMQENATQQASEGTTPTAEGVKSKLQSLITASNAKTGKSDANLTDAVKTLLEGYGQGGGGGGGNSGGDCPINIVDELTEVGVEGAYYGLKKFDVLAVSGTYTIPYGEFITGNGGTATFHIIPTKTTDAMASADMEFHFYYIEDENDIFTFDGTEWASFGATADGAPFCGVISNISEATTDGYYWWYKSLDLYQYTSGQFKQLFTKGGLLYTSNNDGTCSVSGIEKYHDEEIVIPSTSPSGDTVTSIGYQAFRNRLIGNVTFPETLTSIGHYAFAGCRGLTGVILPNGVTEIGDDAFEYCYALNFVTIPVSVTSIGRYAFLNCHELDNITFKGTVAQWNAITKADTWYANGQDTVVYCTDGEVTL